jgi:hypothetical protein
MNKWTIHLDPQQPIFEQRPPHHNIIHFPLRDASLLHPGQNHLSAVTIKWLKWYLIKLKKWAIAG